ncbi:MAG TPA: prepilin-type N-terminal cleavage/methylation domain-containing protein [Candidatus Saccharimonadales bacterium]|nr:prepilin-type N-terminal cleavage/methylation domain-containing protein [Candidatus Saccharimonadales bacterium]
MGGLQPTGQLFQMLRHAIMQRRTLVSGRSQGFTVVEVMIVLIITGALFASAAILISGKQNATAFSQGIQQIQSQIQQTMNEVAIGYYPNTGNFKCAAGASGPAITSAGPNGQGANAGCIFVGKVMQFKVHGTDPEEVNIFTVAGLQKRLSDQQESQGLLDALPLVVAPSTLQPLLPDASTSITMQNNLTTVANASGPTVDGMWYDNGAGKVQIGAVAFTTSFPQPGAAAGLLASGSQQMDVVPIDTSATDATTIATVDAINANLKNGAGLINPTNGVSICFASGGTQQSGLVTIGGHSHPLAVTLTIINGNRTCS